MGMYTEIRTDFTLRPDTPQEIVDLLKWMYEHGEGKEGIPVLPADPFFRCERWGFMMRCGSAYFEDAPEHTFTETGLGLHVKSVSNFKNYNQECRFFFNWIKQYCVPQGPPIGSSLYEEDAYGSDSSGAWASYTSQPPGPIYYYQDGPPRQPGREHDGVLFPAPDDE